jgi:formate hydrogenlyase maturation protein HycH
MVRSDQRVVFYQLSRKFVQEGQAVPAQSKQLIHYALALGHHIGVIDCFTSKLEIPLDGYRDWVARLPTGEGRRKLEGLLRFGEIEINLEHTALLREALAEGGALSPAEAEWSGRLGALLQAIDDEPALYLMVRRRE